VIPYMSRFVGPLRYAPYRHCPDDCASMLDRTWTAPSPPSDRRTFQDRTGHVVGRDWPIPRYPVSNMTAVGRPVPRKEGRAKVTGQARYIDDLKFPGMIYGATVRSPVPRGRIHDIRFGPGIPWDEFIIVRARDIPGSNCISLILDDQPCLAHRAVNH